jgi:hypothetical protein
MSCPICGKHTLAGAKLCGPCRSALKRARDDSVWELPPGLKRPTGTPGADTGAPRWVLGARRSLGWRGWSLVGVTASLLIAGGVKLASMGDNAAVAATPLARPPAGAGNVAEPAVPTTASMAPSGLDKPAPPDAAATAEPTVHAHDVAQPPRTHDRPLSRAAKALTPATETSGVPQPAAPLAPPEPVRVAASPPPAPVRAADPWQPLNDALARCASEGVFARIGCEHRARSRWCEGHWGEVAQCPGAVANDHGQ